MGILGIGLIASIISSFKSIQNSVGFYITSASVILIAMFPMMHKLLNQSPLIWILMFMFSSINKVSRKYNIVFAHKKYIQKYTFQVYVILYWATCVLIAILLMYFQVHKGEKASTALRKYFHILAVFIYLPGFLFECTLLYIATGVVFAIFIILEVTIYICVNINAAYTLIHISAFTEVFGDIFCFFACIVVYYLVFQYIYRTQY